LAVKIGLLPKRRKALSSTSKVRFFGLLPQGRRDIAFARSIEFSGPIPKVYWSLEIV